MAIDSNVQVAIVSVFASMITTFGVVLVALINTHKDRVKAIEEELEPTYREEDIDEVLNRLLELMSENEKNAILIRQLRRRIRELTLELDELRAHLNEVITNDREEGDIYDEGSGL